MDEAVVASVADEDSEAEAASEADIVVVAVVVAVAEATHLTSSKEVTALTRQRIRARLLAVCIPMERAVSTDTETRDMLVQCGLRL